MCIYIYYDISIFYTLLDHLDKGKIIQNKKNHSLASNCIHLIQHLIKYLLGFRNICIFRTHQLLYPTMFQLSCSRYILILLPIGSMYGIYANIGGILMVNVTIYTIHGSYGLMIYDIRWAKWHLFDTRHFCLCEHCAEHIVRQSPRVCPLCRRAVRSLLGTRDGHVGPLRWLKLVYGQLSCFSKCRMGWDRDIFHGCKWVYIYI